MFNFFPRFNFYSISINFGTWWDDVLNGADGNDWAWGFSGNDTISTFAGNDWIRAGKGNDLIFAGEGNDRIDAAGGDDVIHGGAGNDAINGGRGFDTAVYDGSINDYSFLKRGSFWNPKVTVSANDGSETDSLKDVEAVYFQADDYTYYLDGRNNEVLAGDDAVASGDEGLVLDAAALLENDTDFDGDTLEIIGVSEASASGAAVSLEDGQVSYNPGNAFDSLREGETATDTFSYTVTDGNGSTKDVTVTVTVTGSNQAPVLSVDSAVSIAENTTEVTTASATDVDNTDLSYSVSGADAELFEIDAETGQLSFKTAPDFEAPADADGDNVYQVEVTVTDADGGTDTQSVAVTVENENEVVREVFAFDMVGSQSDRLIEFTNNAPDFSSPADGFGKFDAETAPYALVDDTVVFAPDAVGIIDVSTNTDEFFGLADTINGQNSEPLQAKWVFDIADYSNLSLSLDAGAMGDFESSDVVSIRYSIDGGEEQTLFSFTSDDFAAQSYTMASGKVVDIDDPLVDADNGVILSNQLQTLVADLEGSGSELTLIVEGIADGSNEAFVLQNLKLEGDNSGTGTSTTYAIAAEADAKDEGDSGVTSFEFTVTRAGDLSEAGTVDFAVGGDVNAADFGGTLPSGTVEFAAGESTKVITINITGDETTELSEELTVTLSNSTGGRITGKNATSTVVNDDNAPTLISTIQGEGAESGMIGDFVYVSALVTRVTNNGFYMQEEATDSDGNAATSEGIFVYTGSAPTVSVGDEVSFNGTVAEYGGQTQLTNIGDLNVLSSGNELPEYVQVLLAPTNQHDLEAFEGMRVSVDSGTDDALTIIENYTFGRYGQITVSAGVQYQGTHLYDPQDELDQIIEHQQMNENNRILVDDGSSAQNPDEFTYIPVTEENGDNGNGYLDAGDDFSQGATLRLGTEIDAPMEGVLTEGFDGHTLILDGQLSIDESTNSGARTDEPEDVGGQLKVSSFNVLNYFTTLRERGAYTEEDFVRQTDKIVEAMLKIDADVFGLQELENNGFDDASAIVALVEALNAELIEQGRGDELYTFVNPSDGAPIGSDAITTGMIYRPSALSVVETETYVYEETSADATLAIAERLHEFADRDYVGDYQRNRPTVATTFEDANGEMFTLAVNHFKSKGPSGLSDLAEDIQSKLDAGTIPAEHVDQVQADLDALLADPNYDQGDGQGFWAQVREDAAAELHEWLTTDYAGAGLDPDILVIGDLNTYAKGDSVQELIEGGDMTDLLTQYLGEEAYSYAFDGQRGSLDHALASDSLADQVTGLAEWHINADEPGLLGYNSGFSDAGFYAPDQFGASDHDPLIIGLDLGGQSEMLV